jgi:hypothetical protein
MPLDHRRSSTPGTDDLIRSNEQLHSSSDSLIHNYLHIHAAVFGSSNGGLVRCGGIGYAHRPRSHNVSQRNLAILQQERHNRIGAIQTQLLVHSGIAGRISKAFDLDDVAFRANRALRQSRQSGLVAVGNLRGSACKIDSCGGLGVIFREFVTIRSAEGQRLNRYSPVVLINAP